MRTPVPFLLLGLSLLLSMCQVSRALAFELLMPPSWAGKWQIAVTYRDAVTGDIVAADNTTEFLRTGEPVGLEFFRTVANCSGKISDDGLDALCTAKFIEDFCSFSGTWQVIGRRDGNVLTGSGRCKFIDEKKGYSTDRRLRSSTFSRACSLIRLPIAELLSALALS